MARSQPERRVSNKDELPAAKVTFQGKMCSRTTLSAKRHSRLFIWATQHLPITASIGIVSAPLGPSFDPAERELIDDLVNVADTAMYAAKRAGGNQSRSTHIAHAALKGSAA
jgi:GGDEF domain-containing protein